MRDGLYPVVQGGGGIFSPPKQPDAPRDDPDTLRSKTIVDALFLLGAGPIVEPPDLYQAVYLNDVPIRSPDGTMNFNDVSLTLSLGYPSQPYIAGTPAAETLVPVGSGGTKITTTTPVVRAIDDTSATSGRVTIAIPALVNQDDQGNRTGTTLTLAIDVQPQGGSFQQVVYDTISGKCVSTFELDYDFALPGTGPWNVRVRRITPDSTSSKLANDLYWVSYSIVREYRLSYPNAAILRLRIDASQFSGSYPTVKYRGKFLLLQVPSNFDPIARTYSGVWDGTFKVAWSNDPAWVLWNAMVNDLWGFGRWIDTEDLDKWSFYEASVWCNERVSNGKGGVEPRFTFNGSFDSDIEAYQAIVMLAGAFQTMTYWSSGSARLSVDKPYDPVKLLGVSNVVGGKFSYQGTDLATCPTVVHVTWADPENNFKEAIAVAEAAPDVIDKYGIRIKPVVALGCTSGGQATRVGRYEIETAWSENHTLTCAAGEDQHDILPGAIVEVADPSVQGRHMAGRIRAISGTTVTLNLDVEIEASEGYTLRVIDFEGNVQSRDVIASVGTTNVVTLVSAFDPEPMVGAVWQLVATNLAPRRFRILGVEERTKEGVYALSGVLHDPNKQARIDTGFISAAPPFSTYTAGPLAAPTDIVVQEAIEKLPSGTYRQRTTVGWAKHKSPQVNRYAVEYRGGADETWHYVGQTSGLTMEVDEVGSGAFLFRVQALGFDGSKSPWSSETLAALNGLYAPPPNVQGLTIAVRNELALLEWQPVSAANLDHYEVRFSANTGANWESMVPIALRIAGTSMQTGSRSGLFAVKAVTAQNVESINAAFVVTNIAGATINVVEHLLGEPDWIGQRDRVIVDVDRQALRLALDEDFFAVDDFFDRPGFFGVKVSAEGVFVWSDTVDLGEVFTSRVSAQLEVLGERTTEDIWVEPDIFTLANVWGSNPTGWGVVIEVRLTDDDPEDDPVWTPWTRLVSSDLRFRALQARLRLTTTDLVVTPIVEAASIVIDMADRLDARGGVPVNIAGTRVNFKTAFRGPSRPVVVITAIEGASPGDWAEITDIDRTGFSIVIRNGVTAQAGRSIDYHAFGYGAVIPLE